MAKQKVTFINMLVYVLSKLYIRHNKIVIILRKIINKKPFIRKEKLKGRK